MELMDRSQLKKLAKAASHKASLTFSVNGKDETFSANAVDATLREQFKLLAPDYKGFRRNQNLVYELIEDMKGSFKHKFAKKPEVIEGNMNALKVALKEVKKIN